MLSLTVLGSGDASGMPRSDCVNPACACARARHEERFRRGNSCALVEANGSRVAIDTGYGPQTCDALLLTHYHADHAGNAATFAPRLAYGPADGVPPDAVSSSEWFPAPQVPGLDLHLIKPFTTVTVGALRCTALPLNHPIPVHGWMIESGDQRIAWLTDTYGIPAMTLNWLADHPCDLIALDTTFAPGVERAPIKGHGDLATSLAALRASGTRRGLLIHIGHGMQNWLDAHPAAIPESIEVAYDGLRIDI